MKTHSTSPCLPSLYQALDLLEVMQEADKTRGDRNDKKRITDLLVSIPTSNPLSHPCF